MRELAVVSGKGGTGKTSVASSLAVISGKAIIADCDVDTPNLHLVLAPSLVDSKPFIAGFTASIDKKACTDCGMCLQCCRFDAVDNSFSIDPLRCEGCGLCARLCPQHAITMEPKHCGTIMVSETRAGRMVHAKLLPASENSGKLVSDVRRRAGLEADADEIPLVIIDGAPGIGCPVNATITGCDYVLMVAEPSVSGIHDLIRLASLVNHFSIPAFLCVNRWDIHPEYTDTLEQEAERLSIHPAGRIRYDPGITHAHTAMRTIAEYDIPAAADVHALFANLQTYGVLP